MQISNWKHWAVGSVAALTLIAGNVWMADNVNAESATQAPVAEETALAEDAKKPGSLPFGELRGVQQEYLAEALGISVEELESAQETADDSAAENAETDAAERLAQAVEDGKLTQEQADSMRERLEKADMRGFGRHPMGALDQGSNLADALGISVEELQSAQDEAMQAGLAQAVEDGKLTQEQADDILSMGALRDYLSVEMDGVLEDGIQQAVDAGIITQEQADRYLERLDGFGGRDGMALPFFGSDGPMGKLRDRFGHGRGMMPDREGMQRGDSDGEFGRDGMRPGGRGMKPGETPDDSDSTSGSSSTEPMSVPGTLL